MAPTLEVWVQIRRPKGMRPGELILPPIDGGIGWPSQSSAGELALVGRLRESWCTGGSSVATQAQIQGSELAHPKIYII